ncbi:phenylalanine--tRNA ligase subunit alpha [Naumannella cuiyingiana]|uniref:Phenylalanine--tRNA ligase alpha subunit n=1 Tax=Naumannella cuiyingiana TaxID=1347891 RepID=A0A7Z0IMB1_9ACTN|nr:phenylalanine--tRNA ligase subunit alpha [Naumannella cuiyingiana]NYI72397.1 phenylalanyl-tRNA synthetase alpha chain [Naumannella cuiyingiana]
MTSPNDNEPAPPAALDAASVERLVAEAEAAFAAAGSTAELKAARIAHTGDRSALALANREIGSLPPADRKDAGRRIGQARGRVNAALASREAEIVETELAQRLADERVDVTLPVELGPQGAAHPVTALIDKIADVFVAMGWEIAEGPEVESEWMNFDALNLHPDHPARAEQDTLFVEPRDRSLVLRTHTSPVQLRALLERPLPVYVVAPGKVYRADELDATHLPVFHQVEGLVVDEGITLGHLMGALEHFAREMFGDIRLRWRPDYFPFTEPSVEVDLECFVCHGESVGNPDRPCRTCRSEGWIEWGGSGVVNPRVLAAAGVDTDRYTGFAFGMGIERTLMFRNGVEDMRDMAEGDVRFSRSLVGEAR